MVLSMYMKALKDGLLDLYLMKHYPVLWSKPINVGSLSQTRWCPYTLVMVVITNTSVFQRPPSINMLNN